MKRVQVTEDEDPFMKAFASPTAASAATAASPATTSPAATAPAAASKTASFFKNTFQKASAAVSQKSAPSPAPTPTAAHSVGAVDDEINPDIDRERRRREREGATRGNPLQSSSSFNSSLPFHQSTPAMPDKGSLPDLPPPRPLVLPYQDYNHVDDSLMLDYVDDWDSHGDVPGEKLVMEIQNVFFYRDHESVLTNTPHQSQQVFAAQVARSQGGSNPLTANTPSAQSQRDQLAMMTAAYQSPSTLLHEDKSTVLGKLYMTSYQLYLEPSMDKKERATKSVIDGIIAVPLATIERVEQEKPRGRINILDCHCKDGRVLRFGFFEPEQALKAYNCLITYVFPGKDEYLFAFYYKPKLALPPHLNGWNVYNPIAEFKRLGIPNHALRITRANIKYQLSTSYPALIVVPNEKFFTDTDLESVAQFRSRGRVPACTWQHPHGRQTIWRSSQPRVGMNNARNAEDEKLLYAISAATGVKDIAIFDCRPKMNAQANRLAGKGFESSENYRNAKIYFMDIENIHAMRTSYQTLIRACQSDQHGAKFQQGVAASNWLAHISQVLRATFQMVLAIDRDKLSVLSHCSDGWDRTSQLVSLTELCLDPYYRTIEGFCVLVEKDWTSFGHQFAKRTGHRENKSTDDQRSPIMLQWLDCVYQLTQQFPRHFEFNSHLLVTLQSHLYSCRFGTFFYNTEMMRKKTKLAQHTVSLWTYVMCSPAACRGEFTNPLYAPSGNGCGDSIVDYRTFKKEKHVLEKMLRHGVGEAVSANAASVTSVNTTSVPNGDGATSDGTTAASSEQVMDVVPITVDARGVLAATGESTAIETTEDQPPVTVIAAASDASAPAGIVTAASPNAEEPKPTDNPAQSASGQQQKPTIETNGDASTSPTAVAITVTPSSAASVNRGPAHSDEDAPEPRKSSASRGGGDGSSRGFTGTVLYPSWSLKKLSLWSDYYLRWHSDQAEHASAMGPIGPGSVPPYGAATTHFTSTESIMARALRMHAEQLNDAEDEIAALRAKLEPHGLGGDVDVTSVSAGAARRGKTRAPRPVADVSRYENALFEEETDLSQVQEQNDNPEDAAADV